jgi:3-oxoadipate enol-lactonase
MLSHGLALDRSLWDSQIAALAGKFLIIRYDLRGHGASDKTVTTLAIYEQAEDAAGLLRALGVSRVHIIGLSVGGMIGQVLAMRHPDLLASLVLVDTASEVPPENKSAWQRRIADALSGGMDSLVEPTMERWFTAAYRTSHPEVIDWARGLVRKAKLDSYVAGAQAISEFDVTRELGAITTPTLIVVGDGDKTTPIHSARLIHQHVRGSKLEILTPAAHLSNVEQSNIFNALIVGFLDLRL